LQQRQRKECFASLVRKRESHALIEPRNSFEEGTTGISKTPKLLA
jgi:hypothetical protein